MPTEVKSETLVNVKTILGSTTTVPTTSGPGGSATGTTTRVPVNVANVTLLAANALRRGATIFNNTAVATNLFVKLGATANIGAGTESFTVRLAPNAYLEVPGGYTGQIDGIWDVADANGEALITELT